MVISVKINRQQKNLMREQLEKLIELYKDVGAHIENSKKVTEIAVYNEFWTELELRNQETIQKISRYMVTKCNR